MSKQRKDESLIDYLKRLNKDKPDNPKLFGKDISADQILDLIRKNQGVQDTD